MVTDSHYISLQQRIQHNLKSGFYITPQKTVSRGELLSHAQELSKQLPDKRYAINLCRNRYLFTVSYLAAIFKNQINLLPMNETALAVSQLKSEYDESYSLSDKPGHSDDFYVRVTQSKPSQPGSELPAFIPDQIVSISFTSGSTGVPQAHNKTWREMEASALLAINRFGLNEHQPVIISTVPPQHMYGLETSVFWPIFSNVRISSERPFFPEDIRQTINAAPTPCMLITTPTHIKACIRSGISWHNISMVLSSTAPLSTNLAHLAEQYFNAPVYEIFGSTETLSYASRRLTQDEKWTPYPGIRLSLQNERCIIQGGHFPAPVDLDDVVKIGENGQFTVLGRSSDLVKVAGKRISLGELNLLINGISGIDEAVFYQTESERLGALVVSGLDKKEILNQLRLSIDDVFLPRPLIIVDLLPRNEMGKIVKTQLDKMIRELDVA